MDRHETVSRTVNGACAHVRRAEKPDGRALFVYGRGPHNLSMASENLDGGPKDAQLRWHPLRQEWSVYAAGRQNRTFKPSLSDDPLAPMRNSVDGSAIVTEIPFEDFELAIFENRFPSFASSGETELGSQSVLTVPTGVKTRAATGRCEVVVYTSAATGSLATLTDDRRILLVQAWIDRFAALYRGGARFVLPFENRGDAVGVTLAHPHGQIYAFSIIPRVQRDAASAFASGYSLADEMGRWDDYMVAEKDGLAVFAPPFARFPFELWIAPTARRAHLADHSDQELTAFAWLLGEVTRRYDTYFGRDTPYMMSVQASPVDAQDHWHFTTQFYPLLRSPDKIKYLATVEQATGLFTVDVLPEETAKIFRAL
ncbi:MAG: galactose-1-phosphate uridylyltransferase [Pseudomonadota bacterium]